MSKKVRFYLILDFIGIAIAFCIRTLLCNAFADISEQFIQNGITIAVNIVFGIVCLFIIFFFLLYWWSDRKWTNIKRKFKKRR